MACVPRPRFERATHPPQAAAAGAASAAGPARAESGMGCGLRQRRGGEWVAATNLQRGRQLHARMPGAGSGYGLLSHTNGMGERRRSSALKLSSTVICTARSCWSASDGAAPRSGPWPLRTRFSAYIPDRHPRTSPPGPVLLSGRGATASGSEARISAATTGDAPI